MAMCQVASLGHRAEQKWPGPESTLWFRRCRQLSCGRQGPGWPGRAAGEAAARLDVTARTSEKLTEPCAGTSGRRLAAHASHETGTRGEGLGPATDRGEARAHGAGEEDATGSHTAGPQVLGPQTAAGKKPSREGTRVPGPTRVPLDRS